MPIQYQDDHADLEGHASVEDAEVLSAWLRERPGRTLGLARCEHVHAAVLQVVLALRPPLREAPPDRWLAATLAP